MHGQIPSKWKCILEQEVDIPWPGRALTFARYTACAQSLHMLRVDYGVYSGCDNPDFWQEWNAIFQFNRKALGQNPVVQLIPRCCHEDSTNGGKTCILATCKINVSNNFQMHYAKKSLINSMLFFYNTLDNKQCIGGLLSFRLHHVMTHLVFSKGKKLKDKNLSF